MADIKQILVLALFYRCVEAALDDIFRTVEAEYEEKLLSEPSGRSEIRPAWCDYSFDGRDEKLVKLQYDMVLDRATYDEVMEQEYYIEEESCSTSSKSKRNAVRKESKRWPRDIPYDIGEGFDWEDRTKILLAMQHWSQYTCLNFVPKSKTDYDAIMFYKADWGCESYVGKMQGPQPIYLASPGCMNLAIIVHEIGHALGLFHEHMRDIRDEYVTVNFENVNDSYHYNFDKLKPERYMNFSKDYDYLSVMHYGKSYFALNRDLITIQPKNESYTELIGEAKGISFLDAKIVNDMYNCAGGCKAKTCPGGGFLGKNCDCYCKGTLENPIIRCNPPPVCDPPEIDLSKYYVFPGSKDADIEDLSQYEYHDGTVLIVHDVLCTDPHVGNYTCVGGEWENDIVDCKRDGCLYDDARYSFTPEVSQDDLKFGKTEMLAPKGTEVSIQCKSQAGQAEGVMATCIDTDWDIELPDCQQVPECVIGDLSEKNIEIVYEGEVLFANEDTVSEGEEVEARCMDIDKIQLNVQASKTTLTCSNGQLVGDLPKRCPKEFYQCPMVRHATVSGPFSEGFKVTCFPSYDLMPLEVKVSSDFFQCDWRGEWQPFKPTCIPGRCEVHYDQRTGNVTSTEGNVIKPGTLISSGKDVTLTCVDGYAPDRREFTCSSGKYLETDNANITHCRYVECDVPALPSTLSFKPMKDKYLYKEEVRMRRCQENLWFQGSGRITCTENGTWDGTGTCIPFCENGIEELVEFSHKHITGRKWQYGLRSFAACQKKCKTFKRILCQGFSFGYDDARRPRCHITYYNPIQRPNILDDKHLWTVWARKCNMS